MENQVFEGVFIKTKIFIFFADIFLVSLSFFAILTIKTSNQAIVDKATKMQRRN